MKRQRKIVSGLLFSLLLVIAGATSTDSEEITLTTYYPAPFGVYDQMVTGTLGVGDNDGVPGLTGADAPDSSANSGEVWIAGNVGIGTTNPVGRFILSIMTVTQGQKS